MDNIAVLFASVTAFIATAPFVVQALKEAWNLFVSKGWVRWWVGFPEISGNNARYFSWLACLLLSIIGHTFNILAFADISFFQSLIVGIIAGFSANGIYDAGIVNYILKLLKIRGGKNEHLD